MTMNSTRIAQASTAKIDAVEKVQKLDLKGVHISEVTFDYIPLFGQSIPIEFALFDLSKASFTLASKS